MSQRITALPAPRINALQLRRVLGHADSAIVWLKAVDDVDVADSGLTKAQQTAVTEGRIAELVTHAEARSYLDAAGGDYTAATAIANAVIGRLHARGLL
jgi:hypothetical protein